MANIVSGWVRVISASTSGKRRGFRTTTSGLRVSLCETASGVICETASGERGVSLLIGGSPARLQTPTRTAVACSFLREHIARTAVIPSATFRLKGLPPRLVKLMLIYIQVLRF